MSCVNVFDIWVDCKISDKFIFDMKQRYRTEGQNNGQHSLVCFLS